MTNPNDLVFMTGSEIKDGKYAYSGITKREYFAAMAIAVVNWHAALHDAKVTPLIIVEEAVGIADALIAELNK
jgi:hypothetical protein